MLGFCMGVRAAMKKVERAAEDVSHETPVATYGPLIHNRQVIESLADKGVGQVNSHEEVENDTIVIRAHGVPRDVYARLEERGAHIVDGTCPRVMQSMKIVQNCCQEGRHVILVGDPDHGEVQAIASYSNDITIVGNTKKAAEIEVPDNTLVIAQTTVSQQEYDEVCNVVTKKNKNITVVQSICPATQERQGALTK